MTAPLYRFADTMWNPQAVMDAFVAHCRIDAACDKATKTKLVLNWCYFEYHRTQMAEQRLSEDVQNFVEYSYLPFYARSLAHHMSNDGILDRVKLVAPNSGAAS